MIELLLLYKFGKSIGAAARAKGHRGGWYQFLLVAFWFGAEIGTAIVFGMALLIAGVRGDQLGPIMYLGAIVGALFGCWAAFKIVKSLPDLTLLDPPDEQFEDCDDDR